MNNVVQSLFEQLRQVLAIVLKRRWLALAVAGGVAAVSAIGLAFVRDRYEATARVYVDTQSVLKPLMAGLTYQPDIDQQVRMLARTLISRPNVEALVRTPGLSLPGAEGAGHDAVVTRLMDRIKVNPTAAGNLYEISYAGDTPADAQRLVQATVDLFVHAGSGDKKRDSEEAGRFIEAQIKLYEAKLVEAETRLKDFKVHNFGVTGVSTDNQDYFVRVSTLSDEVDKLRLSLGAASQARAAYRRELASEDPQLPMGARAGEGSPLTAATDARLLEQRSRLDDLLRRYTEAHPDVLSTRRTIARLEAEAREQAQAGAAGAGRASRAATSPVYQQLRVSLAEAEAQVASLSSQLALQEARLAQVRSLAGRQPQVEAELAQLNRDYDVIRRNYDQMVARRESASLGVKLDESSQLATFRLVEPPRVASQPVSPSRARLAMLAVLASLAAGIAAALLAEQMRPTFEDAAALAAFCSRPVLGTVGMHATQAFVAGQQTRQRRFAMAAVALMVLQLLWVAWLALHARVP